MLGFCCSGVRQFGLLFKWTGREGNPTCAFFLRRPTAVLCTFFLPLFSFLSPPVRLPVCRLSSQETSMQRLVTMLQQAEEYVGTVVDGKLPADPHMGRRVRNL